MSWIKSLFKPKPAPETKPILWTGKCSCCGKECKATWIPTEEQMKTAQCLACICELTEASKKRAHDNHQVELMKRAIRELELEKTQ